MLAESEENKAQIETECDIEISEARKSFQEQLKQKDQQLMELNNQNGLLVKRSKMWDRFNHLCSILELELNFRFNLMISGWDSQYCQPLRKFEPPPFKLLVLTTLYSHYPEDLPV